MGRIRGLTTLAEMEPMCVTNELFFTSRNMAAAMAAIQSKNIRMTTHSTMHTVEFLGKDDPYKDLTASFPPEHERILDAKLEKLMLDGCFDIFLFHPRTYLPRAYLETKLTF